MTARVALEFWQAAYPEIPAGQVCVRKRAGGDFECWAAAIVERDSLFVRLDAVGGFRNHTAAWTVESSPGSADETQVLEAIVTDVLRRETEGFITFTIDDGEISKEE